VEDGEVTDAGILMFSLRRGMAQTDYHRIVQNMKAGKRRLTERGGMPARSFAPFGYKVVQKIEAGRVRDDAGTYCVIESEAEVVRFIVNRYAEGLSLSGICKELHQRNITSIANERRQLEARKIAAETKPEAARPKLDPENVAEIAAAYASDVLEVLCAATLSLLEKNTCLRRVIRTIRPSGDGYEISSHPMSQVHIHEAPVTGIVMPVR